MRGASLAAATLVLVLGQGYPAFGELPNDLMDYHDEDEMLWTLRFLDGFPHATLVTVGGAYHWYDPVLQPRGPYDMLALRIGPLDSEGLPYDDEGDAIPSILFVSGIHGREWLGTQSLIELASYLTVNAENESTGVPYLLRRTAVWIIPLANPVGRVIDDLSWGDPTRYYVGTGNVEDGWRHNGDGRQCEYGVDINRNFSVGWTNGDNTCNDNTHYRGFVPFSTDEAAALREFVQNHWISMAVDVHSNSQVLLHRWGTSDLAGTRMLQLATEAWDRGLRTLAARIYDVSPSTGRTWRRRRSLISRFVTRYGLDPRSGGTNTGRITDWLDEEQHIQTFLVELPPLGDNYYGHEFEFTWHDANSFHPSSSRVRNLIEDAFVPMALYLSGQANAPSSATRIVMAVDPSWRMVPVQVIERGGSHPIDFGILGAKIGHQPGAPGDLVSFPAQLAETGPGTWVASRGAFDYLDPGEYTLFYWVQNYGDWDAISPLDVRPRSSCRVLLTLRAREPGSATWTVVQTELRPHDLDPLEKEFGEISFEAEADMEYELSVNVAPYLAQSPPLVDDFAENDEKVFRFATEWPF